MLCQRCGKNPIELFIEINNGEKKEKYALCRECFREYYHNLLKNTFKDLIEIIEKTFFEEEKVCPNCGRTKEEIEETKEVGCAYCYNYFRNEIKDLVKKLHKNKRYKGKVPKFSGNKREEILRNKILLSKAIEEEDYEKAAEIRDYLKKLMKG